MKDQQIEHYIKQNTYLNKTSSEIPMCIFLWQQQIQVSFHVLIKWILTFIGSIRKSFNSLNINWCDGYHFKR